jgi:hypothetical protein
LTTYKEQGIGFEDLLETLDNADEADIRVICAAAGDLSESIEELIGTNRSEMMMVRVDEEADRKLNMWVETDAVKSKSEAAALFIKEGLKMRSRELDELTDAINDVKKAKERLQSRAKKIFGKEE